MSAKYRLWGKMDPARLEPYITRCPMSGCWLWTGCVRAAGYGAVKIGRRMYSAHRAAWLIYKGPIPVGMFVLHRCDVPSCCNPAHLFLGTHGDNMADKRAKGREAKGDRTGARLHPERLARGKRNGMYTKPETRPRGERNGHSILTDEAVAKIRLDKRVARIIAAEYGVCRSAISHIKRGAAWRHVE